LQRPFEVGEQVGLGFEPDRQADQRITDAELGARFWL
jgi:hypothetical protein